MRKSERITITAEGRDKDKVFLITEMAASAAERWAIKAMLALGNAGAHIPDNFQGGGMALIASIGISTIMRVAPDEALPLLDEMMTCVRVISSGDVERAVREEDIEEVATRLQLRDEVVKLHVGFSLADKLQTWVSAIQEFLVSRDSQTSHT